VLEPLLFYVLHRASNEICDPANLGTFKTFLMDEAWLFMQNETIRNYVVQAQKTWRKQNAAMILATQSIKELEESGMLQTVAESCPTKIFLANPEMNRDLYRDTFHLNDTEVEIVVGVIPPGQMFIRKTNSSKKVHLNVDSVTHWMATNNARDNLKKRPGTRLCRRGSARCVGPYRAVSLARHRTYSRQVEVHDVDRVACHGKDHGGSHGRQGVLGRRCGGQFLFRASGKGRHCFELKPDHRQGKHLQLHSSGCFRLKCRARLEDDHPARGSLRPRRGQRPSAVCSCGAI
jgi:hypothetical protein